MMNIVIGLFTEKWAAQGRREKTAKEYCIHSYVNIMQLM